MIERPTAIDLFAGVGGLSLGFEQAGFDVVAAVEIDPIHASVHKFNFPGCVVIPRSITDLSGQDILSKAGISPQQEITVVTGGAPCQGFSLMGQRALDDPRNALVKDFLRLVDEIKPQYFVFENVKGLTLGEHRKFLDEIIDLSKTFGYEIISPWRVLNAQDYGVPQNRQRLFLVGVREGAAVPQYPKKLSVIPTCFDALDDLPDAEEFPELLTTDEVETYAFGQPSSYAASMRCETEDAWHYGYKRDWNPNLLTSSMRTSHTDISRRRFRETRPGTAEPISRFFKLPPDGVSNTLRAGTDSARGAFTSPRPIHYKYSRCITVREMARLHGFPDWFRFHTTKWHGARQIGNAVPPPLARAVASEIMKALGENSQRGNSLLQMGDPHLLKMDMKQAASYWSIDRPIAGRNQKSGLRKRKQTEIEALRLSAEVAIHGKTT